MSFARHMPDRRDASAAASDAAAASPAFAALFCERAGAEGRMRFDQFMALALYHPQLGYYRQPRRRVGYGAGTDFFTASTSGPVFGELVCAAAKKLLADNGESAADYVFVEIGAEPADGVGRGGGVLSGVRHPFAGARTIRLGEAIASGGKCVVFSNELFDAQPFRRFVFRDGAWRELGVALDGGALREVEWHALPARDFVTPGQPRFSSLPPRAPEGWRLDLPFASVGLAREVCAQPWRGLFIACDYGKSWRELVEAAPGGTARAYHRHTLTNDLLARPGEQDLTCHVCWDWLADELAQNGFTNPAPRVESQEAFFMRHAAEYLSVAIAGAGVVDAGGAAAAVAEAAAAAAKAVAARKRSLMQLLHPAHLGLRFQVLHAYRGQRDAGGVEA